MLTVKFNQPEEYLDEMSKDPPPDKIVRSTVIYRGSRLTPNIKHVSVLATYLSKRNQIILLEHYCGDVWVGQDVNQKTQQKINEVQDKIDRCAQELGLEVRDGTLET